MKIGFFSDVHGDLERLDRCLQLLEDVDQRVCLGDVLGGRNDRDCWQRLTSIPGLVWVAGNHDLWEYEQVSLPPGALDHLPLTWERGSVLALHSRFDGQPPRFSYIFAASEAEELGQRYAHRRIFFGHTHLHQLHSLHPDGKGGFRKTSPGNIALQADVRYLVNVGQNGAVVYSEEEDDLEVRW